MVGSPSLAVAARTLSVMKATIDEGPKFDAQYCGVKMHLPGRIPFSKARSSRSMVMLPERTIRRPVGETFLLTSGFQSDHVIENRFQGALHRGFGLRDPRASSIERQMVMDMPF